MKSAAMFLTALALIFSVAAGAQTRQQRLSDHLYYLASDELRGRKAGSEDSRKAAEYIRSNYEEIGIKPFFNEWTMPFKRDDLSGKETSYADVVGVIEGADPVLKDEYIVLGAHFDHLGVKGGKIYNGADDNASGSSALIEIARELYAHKDNLRRSVIIAAFDGEELGLYGSEALADTLEKKIGCSKIKLMMSIDMVGWYSTNGKLELEGYGTIKDGRKLLESEASRCSITIDPKKFETSVFTATDTEGFAKKGVPTLDVTTGLKSPYHKPEDDADKIDYEGLDKVSGFVSALAEDCASDQYFAASGKVAPKHRSSASTFEIGIVGSLGSGNISFSDAAFDCKTAFSYTGGLAMNLNFGSLGVRSSVLFDSASSKFPDEDNIYGAKKKYHQNALTVPVALVATSKGVNRGFIGLGPYWSHVFSSKLDYGYLPEENQLGVYVTMGMQAGHLFWSLDWTSESNHLFYGAGDPKASLRETRFTIGYMF